MPASFASIAFYFNLPHIVIARLSLVYKFYYEQSKGLGRNRWLSLLKQSLNHPNITKKEIILK